MATSAVDSSVYRPNQDELLPATRIPRGPVSHTTSSYYTPAPVGPSTTWTKHTSFYPLDKPRRQSKAAPPRDSSKPALKSRPPPKTAPARIQGKGSHMMRRSPTSSSEDLELPSTPSPRANSPTDLFSDSGSNSRDSNDSSPTPASPPALNAPKPALRASAPLVATGSSSFSSSSRRWSLEGRPASANTILFPHQSFSTTYSSRSHDSYLHTASSATSSSSSSARLPKRVSFASNLEAPPTPTPYPAAAPTSPTSPAAAPRTTAAPTTTTKPLHTSLRACRHPTCTACSLHPAGKDAAAPCPTPAPAAAATQLDSICSNHSSSSSLTDPTFSDPTPRGPPTPPLEEEEASYENPTFADAESEEVFHTPRGEAPRQPNHSGPASPAPATSPDSPVLPMPVRSPTLSLNPLHLNYAFTPSATRAPATRAPAAAPMRPHTLPVASDQTVPRHPALLSATRSAPQTTPTAPPPTPSTAPATPAEPSTPRAPASATPDATPQASPAKTAAAPKRSPVRSLTARLAALTTAPAAAASSPKTPSSTSTPRVGPPSLSADAAAPKPTLSLRSRLAMPSTFLRPHASLQTAPAASPSKPPPAHKASAKTQAMKSLAANGYESKKSGWGLLMWDSSAAVTRKHSFAQQNSLFGFEAAMLAEIEARKAREAEEAEAYKVAAGNSIIGSCGGWKESEAAQKRASAKAAAIAAAGGIEVIAPVPVAAKDVGAPGSGFVQEGGAEAVAPFGCFIPFIRSMKGGKAAREVR